MTTKDGSLDQEVKGNLSQRAETIVYINNDGRIVIPRDVRRVLDIEDNQAKIIVHHDNDSAQGIIDVDHSGRATIPVQLRRYLGIDGIELDLRVIICRIDSRTSSEFH